MSDGALSQDEIDALLAGVSSVDLGAPQASSAGSSETDRAALESFLSSNLDAESSNIAMITASQAAFRGVQVGFTNRDAMLGLLPGMVTVVKADFNSGFPGEHLFVMPEATAKAIAGLANKEENIELDDMAMSIINELISQFAGTQITALTNKTGNKSIQTVTPEGANVAKAAAALPAGEFASAAYQLDLGDGNQHQIWEIFGGGVALDISRALTGGVSPAAPAMDAMRAPAMGMPNPAGAMGNMGMPMPNMAMAGGGMQGMGMGAPANVQAVQFPSLMPRAASQDSGNIGLIMDVFMEMTVELGRTRKLIKDILGMGEGTIIELDKLAGEPVDILVNHKLIAKGEVVVIDENFGVRVTEIVSPMERMSDMG
jgi:flagellar motor switch protein FliN/FliY